MNKKLVLMSGGGFDSISALVLYREQIGLVLGIDYGQKAFPGETCSNQYFAKKYSLPFVSLQAVQLWHYIRHPILRHGPNNWVVNGKWQDNFEGDRLEARNLLLLSHAVVIAAAEGLGGVMTGFHRESTTRYVDALPDFYKAFAAAAQAATEYPLTFHAPFQEAEEGRVEVLHRALQQDPEVWFAYTCYGFPSVLSEDPFTMLPCRRCVHCYKREEVRLKLRERGYTHELPLNTHGHVEASTNAY